ncbi:MAG: YCF48-related protein [Candidatus Kapaibacterium sp.]
MKRLLFAVLIFTIIAASSNTLFNWQSAQAEINSLLYELIPPVLTKPQNNSNFISLRPLFDWSDVPNSTKYNLQVSTVADFSTTVINENTIVNSQFTPGAGVLGYNTNYYWRVFAGDESGWGPASTVWNFTTSPPPPSIPWTLYQTGVPYSLFAVDFSDINSQIGVAVGQGGTVIKTSDAGEEWTVTYSNVNIWMNDVKFDPNRDGVVWAAGMGGVIIKSTDFGDTWNVVRTYDTPDHTIRGIGVPPGVLDHAIFIGYAGTYFETFNSGTSFSQRFDIPFTMHSIAFSPNYVTDGRGIISGTDGKVWNTSNFGSSWISRNTNRFDYLNDVVFLSPSIAMICGNNGTILRSTNWGKNWSLNVQYLTSEHLRSIDTYENIVTVCGDNGKIMTANDGGITFADQLNGEGRHLYGVSLREESVGVVVGEIGSAASGALYYTSTNGIVGISQIGSEIPDKYTISQNYPNPFNPTTKINFVLPKQGLVSIKVYDMLGREVKNLVNEVKSAGQYTVDFNGSNLTSGAYFYKIQVNEFSDVKRMLLIK